MTAEPYDERAVHHLNWATFCGSFDVFVNVSGARGADSPSCDAVKFAGHNETPAGQQALPGRYFDGNAILNTFEWVVNSPVVLRIAGFGRWTWPMGFGRVVVGRLVAGVVWTLGQRSVPVQLDILLYCLVRRDFFRAAVFRCRTPLLTARSRAATAPLSAASDSSLLVASAMASVAAFTRLRVNDRVDRFLAALRC